MTAVLTSHTGKTVMQDSAIQIPKNNLLDVGPVKAILPLEPFLMVDLAHALGLQNPRMGRSQASRKQDGAVDSQP